MGLLRRNCADVQLRTLVVTKGAALGTRSLSFKKVTQRTL